VKFIQDCLTLGFETCGDEFLHYFKLSLNHCLARPRPFRSWNLFLGPGPCESWLDRVILFLWGFSFKF